MRTSRMLGVALAVMLALGCGKKGDGAQDAESGQPKVGIAAAENDPQYAPLAEEFRTCKEININCPAYAKRESIGKTGDKDKARVTFMNWLDEPSAWQIRNAGAHILWTQYLIDDKSGADEALGKRVLAAIRKEPSLGKDVNNKYTAVQMGDVLARFSKAPGMRTAIAEFIGDKSYAFPDARGEVIRLLPEDALSDNAIFAVLKTIAEDKSEAMDVRRYVRDALPRVTGANVPWISQWLSSQINDPDGRWAGDCAYALARMGTPETYTALLDALKKRGDDKAFLYGALWALRDYFKKANLAIDKKPGIALSTDIANNAKLDATARGMALDALLASGDPSFKAVATKLSKDKDATVAKRAEDSLRRAEAASGKPGAMPSRPGPPQKNR